MKCWEQILIRLYMGLNEITIVTTDDSTYTYAINKSGYVDSCKRWYSSGVRPAFYLKNTVIHKSGEGTSSNPYRVL